MPENENDDDIEHNMMVQFHNIVGSVKIQLLIIIPIIIKSGIL